MDKKLKKIKKLDDKLIYSFWSDGFESTIELKALRDSCPCAECSNKEKASKFSLWIETSLKDLKYVLSRIEKVGVYALRPVWGDGHDAGIYSWELLREIFEKNKLSDEEIAKIRENEETKN